MSRVGKKPISIPDDVEVNLDSNQVKVKGPEGTLEMKVNPELNLGREQDQIKVEVEGSVDKNTKALWGTTRAKIANMIKGVREGYEKKLKIKGLGYKAQDKGDKIVLEVGFSHPVELEKPSDVNFDIDQDENIITVSGIDKSKVGQVAAKIRNVKPPEPYKGKGIRYLGEEIKRKEGKRAIGTEGGPGGAA